MPTKPINYWIDSVHTMDCIQALSEMPSDFVHLAITSPPYNVKLEYDGYNDNLKHDKYLQWMGGLFSELKRVLVDGGRFALNIAPTGIRPFIPLHIEMVNILLNLGFIMRTEIIWFKQSMRRRTAWGSWKQPSDPHIIPSWEYVYVFSKNHWHLHGDKNDADISGDEFKKFSDGFWSIRPETARRQPFLKRKIEGRHPSPFPEELIYRLIKYYSYRRNIILDPFGGTGTVAAVSIKTDRRYIHIDQSKSYNEIAKRRIGCAYREKEESNRSIFQ